eukprot:6454971-Amphidinium_carterae.2
MELSSPFSIEDVIDKEEKSLLKMDPDMLLDLRWLMHLTEAGGEKLMHDLWQSRCIPHSEQAISPEEALQRSTDIIHGDLFKYVSTTAQGHVHAAHAMLEQVSLGSPPCISVEAIEWLNAVFLSLVNFATFKMEKRKKSDGEIITETIEMRGVEALKANSTCVLQKKQAELTIKDFWWLVIFPHALPEGVPTKLQSRMKEVVGKEDEVTHTVPGPTLSKPCKKRKEEDKDGEAMRKARALLDM